MKPNTSNDARLKSYHERVLPSIQDAEDCFQQLKLRLYNINEWKNYFQSPVPEFVLLDKNANLKKEIPEAGDYVKIDLPGPGSVAGEGFDWVVIDRVYEENNPSEDSRELHIRVRPSTNPENTGEETAHFYTEGSTSEFCGGRSGNVVYGWVMARGEEPNVKEATGWMDKLRNMVVGITARAGMSEIQWEQFIQSMLESD